MWELRRPGVDAERVAGAFGTLFEGWLPRSVQVPQLSSACASSVTTWTRATVASAWAVRATSCRSALLSPSTCSRSRTRRSSADARLASTVGFVAMNDRHFHARSGEPSAVTTLGPVTNKMKPQGSFLRWLLANPPSVTLLGLHPQRTPAVNGRAQRPAPASSRKRRAGGGTPLPLAMRTGHGRACRKTRPSAT